VIAERGGGRVVADADEDERDRGNDVEDVDARDADEAGLVAGIGGLRDEQRRDRFAAGLPERGDVVREDGTGVDENDLPTGISMPSAARTVRSIRLQAASQQSASANVAATSDGSADSNESRDVARRRRKRTAKTAIVPTAPTMNARRFRSSMAGMNRQFP